jgi:hypothetical protein
MLELQLDDTYKISSDRYNFVLEKNEEIIDLKTKQPTGKFKYKDAGYFGSNFAQALKRYVTESIRDVEKAEVSLILDRINQLERHIDRVVKRENIRLTVKEKEKENDE